MYKKKQRMKNTHSLAITTHDLLYHEVMCFIVMSHYTPKTEKYHHCFIFIAFSGEFLKLL